MAKRIITTLIISVCVAMSLVAAKNFTLVIDAGHGGHDSGAVGSFSQEKNINLSTALAFGRYVEKYCPDVNVIYTRKTDVFVTLHGRAEIANKAKADLFISIHTNSLPGKNVARGMETYTLGMNRAGDNLDVAKRENSVILVEKDYKERYQGFDPNSAESYIIFEFMQDNNMKKSVELAKLVQNNVCSMAGRPNKGVKQAGFLVLRETSMPSCLIELGFISTADEEKFLNNPASIDKMARGIYQAFADYRKKYSNVSYKTASPVETETSVEIPKIKEQKKTEPAKTESAKGKSVKSKEAGQEKPTQEVARASAKRSAKRTSGQTNTVEPVKTAEPVKPVEPVKPTEPAAVVEQNKPAKSTKVAEPAKTTKAAEPTKSTKTTEPAKTVKTLEAPKPDEDSKMVFKVQILASDKKLKDGDPKLKGVTDAAIYTENGMTKYTLGESEDYNEMLKYRLTLLEKFPDCFVIAFKGGTRMDIRQAVKEFKSRKQ